MKTNSPKFKIGDIAYFVPDNYDPETDDTDRYLVRLVAYAIVPPDRKAFKTVLAHNSTGAEFTMPVTHLRPFTKEDMAMELAQ